MENTVAVGDAVTVRDALVKNAAKVRVALVGEVVILRFALVGEKEEVTVRDEVVGAVEKVRGALVMEAVAVLSFSVWFMPSRCYLKERGQLVLLPLGEYLC